MEQTIDHSYLLAYDNAKLDTNKFGFKMMEKMGWSQGKGLGAKEDGVQEHVKVRLKENHLGVGATKKSSDNWLGNTDAFSRLLADLNERVEQDSKEIGRAHV